MVPVSSLGRWPWFQAQVSQSWVLPQVHPVNPLPELRFLADVDDYKRILENPQAQRLIQEPGAFANRPDYQKLRLGHQGVVNLVNHKKFREMVSDPEFRELVKQRPLRELLVHEKVLALGFDPEIRRILNDDNFRARLKAALEEAEKLHPKKR
jgi:hypothetical protein